VPRAKSTSYDTTRIELGVKEREMMETFLLANAIPNLAIGAGVLVAGAGVGLASYSLYQWLSESPFDDFWPDLKDYLYSVLIGDGGVQMPTPPNEGAWNDPENPEYERQYGGGQGGAFGGPRPGNPNFWEQDADGNWVRIA